MIAQTDFYSGIPTGDAATSGHQSSEHLFGKMAQEGGVPCTVMLGLSCMMVKPSYKIQRC